MLRRPIIDRMIPDLRNERYDVVHVQTPFVAHYAGVHIAKELNVPVVESYHTFFEEYLYHYVPFVPRGVMRMLARRFTVSQCNAVHRIVSPSSAMQAALGKYGVRTPIEVLPTGLDQAQFRSGDRTRFRTKHGISADTPTLLYVGRVAHEKNIGFLLNAFRKVLAEIPQALFVIAGEGPALETLRDQAKELGILERIKFIGYLDRDSELLDCYRAADLFVFASKTETQGLVLLEALAQGTPVVSTAYMGTRDVLENARGVRIAVDDVAAFGQAVCHLLRDASAREKLGVLAPIDAAKWSSQAFAERLVRCYQHAIEARSNGTTSLARATA